MILLIGAEKGGTGKTTIAVNMAAMRAMHGKDVLLVDTDQQESATTWAMARSQGAVQPVITCVSLRGKVGFDLVKLKEKYDTVIVDAGGRDSVELRQAMAVCDKMIMPFRPSQFDTWSLDKMSQLLKDITERTGQSVKASAMLNAVSSNPSVKEAEEMRLVLAEYADEFPTLEASLSDRIAVRRAARDGICVTELKKEFYDTKAAVEIEKLYKEIFHEQITTNAAE